jgi:hypothetical protein
MVSPDLSVSASVLRDLEEIRGRDPRLAESTLAAAAVALAAEMDSAKNGGTSKAMIGKELRETLAKLFALAPAKAAGDSLDDLTARRQKRLAG